MRTQTVNYVHLECYRFGIRAKFWFSWWDTEYGA